MFFTAFFRKMNTMKIVEDIHIHTRVSKDSRQDPGEYVEEAINRNIQYLGFSDHLDLDPLDKDYGYYKYEDARADFDFLKTVYGQKINLLFGVEVTFQTGLERSILEHTENKGYDYMIGSVHRLDGFTIAGTSGIPYFEGKDEKTAYIPYFEEMKRMVDFSYFPVIGHFDVIKRFGVNFYGKFDAFKYEGIIREIFKVLVKQGSVIELNSSGFRQPPREPYPSLDILEMYADEGGSEIVIGSDAHTLKQFGDGLEKSLLYAKKVFDFSIVVFIEGKKIALGKISEFENTY